MSNRVSAPVLACQHFFFPSFSIAVNISMSLILTANKTNDGSCTLNMHKSEHHTYPCFSVFEN